MYLLQLWHPVDLVLLLVLLGLLVLLLLPVHVWHVSAVLTNNISPQHYCCSTRYAAAGLVRACWQFVWGTDFV